LNRQDKITWYEEVLTQDPASPVFFNLAQLYMDLGETEKAVEHLQAGLDRNPAHTQARLLLIQNLGQAHGLDHARPYAAPLFTSLQSCPYFWTLWAEKLEEEGYMDRAVAVRFIEADIRHESLTWVQLMHQGVMALAGLRFQDTQNGREDSRLDTAGVYSFSGAEEEEAEQEEDAVQEISCSDEYTKVKTEDGPAGGYRTVTMADILAGQGAFEAALEIYAERLACETGQERRQQIQERMNSIEHKLRDQKTSGDIEEGTKKHALHKMQDPAEDGSQSDILTHENTQGVDWKPKKQELLRRLDRLAARLEAKEFDP